METSKVKAQLTVREARERFFIQHIGQTVVHTGEGKPMRSLNKKDVLTLQNIELILFSTQRSVLLRTFEQLTDEELINCAYLHWKDSTGKPVDTGWVKRVIGTISPRSDISDYLRAIGVLTSFTFINEQGKPEPYSPEKLIELGWAKIKND